MENFNGECEVKFEYKRVNGFWKLISATTDGRIRDVKIAEKDRRGNILGETTVGKAISRAEGIVLPQRCRERFHEYLPYTHEGLLLEILGRAMLDGGSIYKKLSGEYGRDGATYTIVITVEKHPSRCRTG
jgi:hypothetical protein